MEFFQDVLGMVSEPDLLATGFTVTRPNDPTDGLFADEATDNLMARWEFIASEYQIPEMAQFHAFDTEAQKSVRVPIDSKSVEKGLIKVKCNTSELLYELTKKGIRAEEALYRYVMDDVTALANQVITRTKVAKNELLATGQITIKENDLDLTVDYGVPAAHKGLTLDFGAGAAKPVVDQLQDIADLASDAGVELSGMVCARSTVSKMRRDASIQKAVNGVNMQGVLVTNSQLEGYLSSEFGINRVITNDLKYSLPRTVGSDGRPVTVKKRYFPKAACTFFGTGNGMRLGVGLWGAPPEEQIASFEKVNPSGENPYVYMTQWAEKDPAVVWTKASGLFMPVLFNPDSLYIADVTETPASS